MPLFRLRPFLPLLLALATAALSPVAHAGEQVFRYDYPGHLDTFVEIESVFGPVGKQGSLPFRITIRNNSGKTRTWSVKMKEGDFGRKLTTTATYPIEVESGDEAVREVSFAFPPSFLSYDYRNLEITVSAPGLPTETRNHGEQTPQDYPVLAISQTLGERNLTSLDNAARTHKSGSPHFAKLFDPGQLPVDWLGYTGLDALLLDEAAWRDLTAGQRQALVAWIRLGGRLELYGKETLDPSRLGLPLGPFDTTLAGHPLSLGSVALQTWDGRDLPTSLVAQYGKLPQASTAVSKDYGQRWGLYTTFGKKYFNPFIVFVLLVAFAILVAPVNLFYLAKSGRRHLLFITTPIISIVTCLVLVLVILFLDGIGGKGHRVVFAELQAGTGEAKLYTVQEQLSRTGVMVNAGFRSGREYDLVPLDIPATNFNPLTSGDRSSTYDMVGGIYDGDFFRSRSEQAFALRAAEPSRSRLEYQGEDEGTPILVSNLAQAIVALRYVDAAGQAWTTEEGALIAPGQRIPLSKAESEEPAPWILETAKQFGTRRSAAILRLANDRHRFFAQVADPSAFALPTHPRLRWERTEHLLTGTPTGAPLATSAP